MKVKLTNKEIRHLNYKRYYAKHKEKINKKYKDYYIKNKNKVKEYKKKYNLLNKDEIRKKREKYYFKNKKLILCQTKEYSANRKKKDISYKIASYLRSRLNKALNGNYKLGSAVKDLGCSIDELKIRFEQMFQPGMTWENHGKLSGQWSIDHIIPLSKLDLTDKEQLLRACHFTNLQPMWHIDNIKKYNK